MMRKKHLRAALAEEKAKNSSLWRERDYAVAEHLRVLEIAKEQEDAIERLMATNFELQHKQQRANELFGKALAMADHQKTGPSRPNRKKLTEREVRDIRQAYQGGMKQKDLADNYDVNPATISRLVRGIYH